MRVTVCELPDDLNSQEAAWDELVAHARGADSELVLLPEMPFFPWIAAAERLQVERWQQAVDAHTQWGGRLEQLAPALVVGSRPVVTNGKRFNQGFVWQPKAGTTAAHQKVYLPNEAGFWEANWYDRGQVSFEPITVAGTRLGFAICSELWFTEHARTYARRGVQLLVCPRATELHSVDKWLVGGKAAAIMSGAFCLSSNRSGRGSGIQWGGAGWIIDPDGKLLGMTTAGKPYLTLELNLAVADGAKLRYPRNLHE